MKDILKELTKKLLNKKMTLLELDNKIQKITNSTDSLFDTPDSIEEKCYSYNINNKTDAVVEYTIIKQNKDKLKIKIKAEYFWLETKIE